MGKREIHNLIAALKYVENEAKTADANDADCAENSFRRIFHIINDMDIPDTTIKN